VDFEPERLPCLAEEAMPSTHRDRCSPIHVEGSYDRREHRICLDHEK
jgi:hypothetical protein